MSTIRLFILTSLAERGPMHGHRMRLQAAEDRTEQWSDITPGSLYAALGRMTKDGLIRSVRTEREANYPEREVYDITPEGRVALDAMRERMLRDVAMFADPFDMALAHATSLDEHTLRSLIGERLDELRRRHDAALDQLSAADPWLTASERAVCEHVVARLEAEVRWHDELYRSTTQLTSTDTKREATA